MVTSLRQGQSTAAKNSTSFHANDSKDLRIRDFPYEERLEHLNLWTLEERRNRSDLIEVFKMHNGLTKIPFDRFFELKNDLSVEAVESTS